MTVCMARPGPPACMHASARACIFDCSSRVVLAHAMLATPATIGYRSQHSIGYLWGCVFKESTAFRQLPSCHKESSALKLFFTPPYFRSVGRTANDRSTMTGLVSRRTRPSCPNFPRTGTLTPGWYYSTAMTGQAGTKPTLQAIVEKTRAAVRGWTDGEDDCR